MSFGGMTLAAALLALLTTQALAQKCPDFEETTRIRGRVVDSYVDNGVGVPYRVSYNAQVRGDGIIALDDAAAGLVSSVRCRPDGSVVVRMRDECDLKLSLAEMYPTGAVLAVDLDTYPGCIVGQKRRGDVRGDVGAQFLNTDDNLLQITSVSGSPYNAVIRGDQIPFAAIFDDGSITARRIGGGVSRATDMSVLSPGHIGLGHFTSQRQSATTTVGDETTFAVRDNLDLFYNVKFTPTVGVRLVKFEFSLDGVDIRVQLERDLDVGIEVGLEFTESAVGIDVSDDIDVLSIPLFAVTPKIKIRGPGTGGISTGVGVYFDVEITYAFTMDALSFSLRSSVSYDYNIGFSRVEYRLSVPSWLRPGSWSVSERVLEEKSPSQTLTPPTLSGLGTEVTGLKIEASVGLQVGLEAAVSLFEIETGVVRELQWSLEAGSFGPLDTSKTLAVRDKDICQTCHLVRGALDLNPTSILLKAEIDEFSFRLPILGKITIPETELLTESFPLFEFVELFRRCALPQFGEVETTELCPKKGGKTCCDLRDDKEMCGVDEMGEDVCLGETSSPTPSPKPCGPMEERCGLNDCCPKNDPRASALLDGDVHLTSFDGLRFSCQAQGEFTLVENGPRGLIVQGRFQEWITKCRGEVGSVSVTTALVIKEDNSPTVQASIPFTETLSATEGPCLNVDFLVNGKPVSNTFSSRKVSINGNSILLASGSRLSFSLHSRDGSCHMRGVTVVMLGESTPRGLLGNANGDTADDWTTPGGRSLAVEDVFGRMAYNFCANWCLKSRKESLFKYEDRTSFRTFNKCDAAYESSDLMRAPAEIRRLCGDDQQCLIDGAASCDPLYASETVSVATRFDEVQSTPAPTPPPTSVGEEFWMAFPRNYLGTDADYQVLISGEQGTRVTVRVPGIGFTETSVLNGRDVLEISIPIDPVPLEIVDQGILVTADSPVVAYGMSQQESTTDAYLALPVNALGTRYRVLDWPFGFGSPQVTFIATEDNTRVNYSIDTVVLDRGEVFTVEASSISGVLVTSNKRVGLLAGNNCGNVPDAFTTACDHIISMQPPIDTWGTSAIVAPFENRIEGDTIHLIAAQSGTILKVNGRRTATLAAGESVIFDTPSDEGTIISANKPFLAAQHLKGSSANGVTSDPSSLLLYPPSQYLSSYLVVTALPSLNFLNLVVPKSAIRSVRLDGARVPAASFTDITRSTFSYARVPVSPGSHTVSADVPFGVSVYGYGSFESYAYPGGAKVARSS